VLPFRIVSLDTYGSPHCGEWQEKQMLQCNEKTNVLPAAIKAGAQAAA
jgi:hypothetical protein